MFTLFRYVWQSQSDLTIRTQIPVAFFKIINDIFEKEKKEKKA